MIDIVTIICYGKEEMYRRQTGWQKQHPACHSFCRLMKGNSKPAGRKIPRRAAALPLTAGSPLFSVSEKPHTLKIIEGM